MKAMKLKSKQELINFYIFGVISNFDLNKMNEFHEIHHIFQETI